MQTPTSIKGLKAVLKALGFKAALDGVDVSSPDVKNVVVQHIEWKSQEDPNAFSLRRKKALDLVNLFNWSSVLRAQNTEIPAPEGTEAEVFTMPVKKGKRTFVIHSPTRTVELAAEADKLATKLDVPSLPTSVRLALAEAADLLNR